MHHVRGRLAEGGTEVVEIFEVGFVDSITNDFNVEVVEVVGGETFTEVRCYCGILVSIRLWKDGDVPRGVSTSTL